MGVFVWLLVLFGVGVIGNDVEGVQVEETAIGE